MKKWAVGLAFALILSGCNQQDLPPTSQTSLDESSLLTLVSQSASDNHVPAALVYAVLETESGGNPTAISRHGAVGLMQLMPATIASCNLRAPFDPRENLECGASYLSRMLARFRGNVGLAVAAYNAGPGTVSRFGGVPPQSQEYVRRVLRLYALGLESASP